MTQKILLILFFIFIPRVYPQESCGTLEPNSPSIYSTTTQKSSFSGICVDVQFYIIRNNNGTSAFIEPSTNDMLDELNQGFNEHYIFFNNIGTNTITNSSFVDINYDTQFSSLRSAGTNSAAINVYIVDSITNNDGGSIAGVALLGNKFLIINDTSSITSTLIHEMGHVFDLYHTHSTAFGIENILRTNCTVAGDLLCDTYADPNLSGKVDISCNFNPDPGEESYNPLIDNYMSYSRRECRDDFTDDQVTRMRVAIQQNGNLSNTISSTCSVPELSGGGSICWPNTKTLLLSNPIGTVNWSVTYPLIITSSSNTSVTVKGISQTASGTGTVTATMDNNVVRTANVTAYGQANSSTTSLSVYSNGSSYIDVTVNGGSGNTPYYWYLNNSFAFTTTTRTASFYYTENSVRLEVHNLNQCGQYLDQAFFTGPIPGRGYYYRTSPNPTSEMITVKKNNYEIEDESYSKSNESFDQTETILTLYDFNNRIMSSKAFRSNDMNMDVSTLNPGIYILEIVSDKIKEQHKIVIE